MKIKGRHNVIFFILLLVLLCVGYSFNPPAHLDLIRYYEMVEDQGSSSSSEVAEYFHLIKFDFVYFYLLAYFKHTFLGMTFLTGLINMVFYYLVLKDADSLLLKYSKYYFVLMFGLFCFPNFIWVLELSRTALAVIFFFIGVLIWMRWNKFYSLAFFALAMITHTTSIMFSLLFILSYYSYVFFFYKKDRLINILSVILPFIMLVVLSIAFKAVINNPLLAILVGDSAYQGYLGGISADANGFAYAEYGTVAIMIAEMVSVYLLLNVSKQNSLERFLLLIFGSVTIGFCYASGNFYKRFALCFTLFYAMYFVYLYKNEILGRTKNRTKILRTMSFNSYICIFSFLLEFYAYRFWTLI